MKYPILISYSLLHAESNLTEVDSENTSELQDNFNIGQEIQRLKIHGKETSRDEITVTTSSATSFTEEENSVAISEAGRFFLAAVCAISLGQLFEEKWDADFRSRSIRFILANLQLPKRVRNLVKKLNYRNFYT